jgi:pimeloyl-ACP methyl ester carboxylesterase
MAAAPPAVIEGDGDAVVLVHGFPLDGRMWAPQVATLRERYRVIVPDVLGFGPAGPGPDHDPDGAPADGLPGAADGLAALLDDLGIDRAVLCGCSMGGYIALAFLRRHPGRLRALVLVDTRADADSEQILRRRRAQLDRLAAEGVGSLPEELLPRYVGETSHATRPAVVEALTRMILEQDPRAVAGALRAMAARPDSTPLLRAVTVPALVVVGEEDVLAPPPTARAMATAIPGAKFAEIPYAGHLPSLEVPDELDRVLQQFLSELGQTTP